MNLIARLITTALIAAMALVGVSVAAQADSHPPGSPTECDPLTSPPGACDPGTPPAECDPLTSQPGACYVPVCEPTVPDSEPVAAPGASATPRPGDAVEIARLKAKVQQLRERLRSR